MGREGQVLGLAADGRTSSRSSYDVLDALRRARYPTGQWRNVGLPRMTKQQRLRNVAEGLMAGLVANGFTGPWRWAHHQWEGAFYRVWCDWPPAQRDPASFPTFQLGGGAGRTSQARDMLWTLKSTSPFHNHDRQPLTTEPLGMTPVEYLEIWVKGAHPDEWIDLARRFLAEMKN